MHTVLTEPSTSSQDKPPTQNGTDSTHLNANVLVVDDTASMRDVLALMLRKSGYKVCTAANGETALKEIKINTPDLILLDINMPLMSGYEVCECLKRQPEYQSIPVIFLSAMTEQVEIMKAFSYGAVDYVTKPFHFDEVKARVDAHLKIHFLQQQLEDKTLRLAQSLEELKKAEAIRETMTQMLVHDLRSPLAGIEQGLSLVISNAYGLLDAASTELLDGAQKVVKRLIGMVSDLLDVSRMEANKMPCCKVSGDLCQTVKAAVEGLSFVSKNRIKWILPETPTVLFYDTNIIGRVVANLFGNSLKYSPNGLITVCIDIKPDHVVVSVSDTGPGITEELQNRLFEKFSQLQSGNEFKRHSSGLGLAFCKLAVELHGGKIGVKSQPGEGRTFWFILPKES